MFLFIGNPPGNTGDSTEPLIKLVKKAKGKKYDDKGQSHSSSGLKMTLFASTLKDGQPVGISWINNFYSVEAFPNKRLTEELQQSKLIKCLWND